MFHHLGRGLCIYGTLGVRAHKRQQSSCLGLCLAEQWLGIFVFLRQLVDGN